MSAIEDKKYSSTVRLDLAQAAHSGELKFFTQQGDFAAPSDTDPDNGVVQNLNDALKIANGDLYMQAVGLIAQPYIADYELADGPELLQKALTTFSALGAMEINQSKTEIVSVGGPELLDPPSYFKSPGAQATNFRFGAFGKVCKLNQPRLLIGGQTFTNNYKYYVESSASLTSTTLYVTAFMMGRFFPGGIAKFPDAMRKLGISERNLPGA